MRILVSILTSSKPDLAKLCYDSVASQLHSSDSSTTDIVVIVNSTNPDHITDIRRILPPGANIQETESNGKPGKGHNSVLRYFRSQPQYDYCVIIDGDDFLYPRALSRLQHYLRYEPDVLFIAFQDILQSELPPPDANVPYITFRNKCVLSYNVEEFTLGEWYRIKGAINPFRKPIDQMNSYARPFVFSRKSVTEDIDIYYDENVALYDDFMVFLKAFELHNLGKLKTYAAVDTNLYLYNSTSQDAATKRFFAPENAQLRQLENEYYQSSIRNRFLTLKQWDLKRFPLLELGQTAEPDEFLTKCQFIDNMATDIRLQCMVPQQDNMDIILRYCKETGNQAMYDGLINTLTWLVKRK
jgi:hypothetical protein